MASIAALVPVVCSSQTIRNQKKIKNELHRRRRSSDKLNSGPLANVAEVVRKDFAFLKLGLTKWAATNNNKSSSSSFHLPKIPKPIEDLIWLRNIEDPKSSGLRFPSFPQPHYPELSAFDLFLADLKALEVYAGYFYYLSKMWTKPLPETYDPEEITEYFTLRPHVVALRLLEVFTAFASATIKFRISRISSAADQAADEKNITYNFGIVLKETLLNLGPTFIKVGQSLSTRPDMIGSEISKAFSELNDRIPPFPRAEAMKIIEEELGSPVETFFRYISEEPVAAASFGQVYKASTHDGFDVAVKVQRPNLRHVVVRDIYILRIGLGLLQKIAKRKNDLRVYADELGKGLIGELDYNVEAENALDFLEAHSRFPFITSPKLFQHLSKKRVLTMEWMAGDSPTELISASSPESNRKLLDLVNKGVEAALVQLLETGILHADPHHGNLRYMSSGKLGFLDFGLLCRMEKKHQFAMLASIVHIVTGDWASLVNDLTEMDVIRPGTNIKLFTMDLEDALEEVKFSDGIPDVKFSQILGKIWSVALKYHCRMPPYYVLVLRSLASLEGLALAADPTFKTFEAAYPYVVQKLLIDNSAATRKILHSVVFNRRREFQWPRLAVFLRIGATRKGLQALVPSNTQISLTHPANRAAPEVNIANLALNILPSKKGLVLRRLLMTADGASLLRAMISNEASSVREQLCQAVADVRYRWMSDAIRKGLKLSRFSSPGVVRATAAKNTQTFSSNDFSSILRDRRLRIIFFKALNSAKKDPILMLRFCWASFVLFSIASALACHRLLVSLSGVYLDRLSFSSKQIAVNAQST